MYENKCPSLTGLANLIEVTSSGLSHSLADFMPFPSRNVQVMTSDFYAITKPFVDLNYGTINLDFKPDGSILEASVKDING